MNSNFISYLKDRFGITLPYFLEVHETQNKVYVKRKGSNFENVDRAGLIAATKAQTYKPTTNFLQRFGDIAIKHIIFLTEEEAIKYARGEDIPNNLPRDGFVIVVDARGDVLGCGVQKDNLLVNQVSKSRRLR